MTTLAPAHQKPWSPRQDRDQRFQSALHLAQLVVANDWYPAHRTELLSLAVWKATELDGKWRTRFRSTQVIYGDPGVKINHEHVVARKWLISSMISIPSSVNPILSLAVGCMVTADEHKQLTSGWGWERYINAGVVVIDAKTGDKLDLNRAHRRLAQAASKLGLPMAS